MERESIHELTAAYAMDALDENERREFEAHLSECGDCADEVDSLREAAASLAYAAQGPAPPDGLRERLLEQARAELPAGDVIPLRRRAVLPAVAALAAAAALLALGLGIWAATLAGSLDSERSARRDNARAVAILAGADTRRLPMGGRGQVVLSRTGEAVLVVPGLPRAPDGKTYEAWVVGTAGPLPAGLFEGGRQTILLLDRPVPEGARVAVSIERAGGVDSPTLVLFGSQTA